MPQVLNLFSESEYTALNNLIEGEMSKDILMFLHRELICDLWLFISGPSQWRGTS